MTAKERKLWRAKWIDRLIAKGVPFSELAGVSDHVLWQKKNRFFGAGTVQSQEPIKIAKHRRF